MGCMVPQPFAAGGNQSYREHWAVTGGLRYQGYFTPIVAPVPSVERAVKKHPLDGRKNRCFYVTAGTFTGFSGEIMGLIPP
jgi:hypothetical protein